MKQNALILLLSLCVFERNYAMHTPVTQLADTIKKAEQNVTVGGTYHHYSDPNKHYLVIACALSEASEEVVVVYKSLYEPYIIWTRPLTSWLATVKVKDQEVPRFSKVTL